MAIVLKYKISTTIGIVILMTITIFCIVTITNRAFSETFEAIESSQRTQLNLIKDATGNDMDRNNVANWHVYNSIKYGFKIKYPETSEEIEDAGTKIYSEEYPDASDRDIRGIQPQTL